MTKTSDINLAQYVLSTCLTRHIPICRHNIPVDINDYDKDFRYQLSAICFVDMFDKTHSYMSS